VSQDPKASVAAPSSQAQDFSTQVEDFLALTAPTTQTERIVQQVTAHAEKAIKSIFAEVDVAAVTTMVRVTAGGDAVPEIDLIASARQERLLEHLQERIWKRGMPNCKIDARKIQRSATRSWTELLVMSQVGFKFRQAHFRSQDAKAALMAPPSFWVAGQGIPVEFSANHAMSVQNMALLAECKRLDPRAESLILLVKRWAKDRGVCHEYKDDLTPFAWTLLVVYFLQVGVPQGPLLPPLVGTLTSPEDGTGPETVTFSGITQEWNRATSEAAISVGDLFKTFFIFYSTEIDFRQEAISVRTGVRAPPSLRLPLHIVVHSDQRKEVGPVIEDPFEITRNLGNSITASGMARLTEELTRSLRLLQIGGSLSELLQEAEKCDGDDILLPHLRVQNRSHPPRVHTLAGVHADTNTKVPITPDPPEANSCPEAPAEEVPSEPVPPQARCGVESPLGESRGGTGRKEPLEGNHCVGPSIHADTKVASEAASPEVKDCGKTPADSTEKAPGSMDPLERVHCVGLPEEASQPDPPEANCCPEAPAEEVPSGPVPPQARCCVETPLDASRGGTRRKEPLEGNKCVEPSTHANTKVASEAVFPEVTDCGKIPSDSTEKAPGSMDALESVHCVDLPANTNREVASQPDPPEMDHRDEAPADVIKAMGALKPVGAIKPAGFIKPAGYPKPVGVVKPVGLIKPAGLTGPAAQQQEHKSAQFGKVMHAESTDDNTPDATEKLPNGNHAAKDLPVVSDTSNIST